MPPSPLSEEEEVPASPDYASSSSASSTSTLRPLPPKNLFARPQLGKHSGNHPLDPLPWTSYFAQELYLGRVTPGEEITYHVYLTPPKLKGPLFVTHHGAGSSGLSFAVFASELLKILPDAGLLSVDARGHGGTVIKIKPETQGSDEVKTDLQLETLHEDMVAMLRLTQAKMQWSQLPELLLIGHSLGGAVVTDVAKGGKLGDRVLGYAVLDVVEGSAIDALQSMQTYLSTRPSGFPSLVGGIEWHTRSRTLRNTTSARISVPALLQRAISANSPDRAWVWRTNLAATQPFWEGWFKDLSGKFLSAKGGKLLLLAGTDRLDKELMIGQMQGKYQLQVFPEAGHFIHEDLPEKTAMVVADFYKRNDRSALILPPKMSDVLKQQAPAPKY
ncbi:MAG: Protein phosphatase methylesterase 1 [Sarcosagium campestre]|nr:MAG: Protein phosphatase methylesterase 1 [Sarcosagium campestre]